MPKAKSKQFYVPKWTPVDPELDKFIKPIERQFKAEMRSIVQLFMTETKFTDQASQKAIEEKKKILALEKELFKKNEETNKEILRVQLKHEEIVLKKKIKELEHQYFEKQRMEKESVEMANKRVALLKQKAQKFIDPSRIDEEIEKALNERVDYNFCVDSGGHFFKNKKPMRNPLKGMNPMLIVEESDSSSNQPLAATDSQPPSTATTNPTANN